MAGQQQKTPGNRCIRLVLSVSVVTVLAGCGGEDIDLLAYLSRFGAPDPINPGVLALGLAIPANMTTLTTNLLNTARYQNTKTNNWSVNLDSGLLQGLNSDPLRTSGAAFAHALGLTGKGALIAFSDESFQPGYAEFAGKIVTIINNAGGNDPHGTVVAAVATGNSADYVGTAPGADIMFGTFQSPDPVNNPADETNLINLGVAAEAAGAVAWNNSWGYSNTRSNEAGFNAIFSGTNGSVYYYVLQDFAKTGVVVFSAANDETLRHSQILEGLPAIRPQLEAGWIAAVNGVPQMQNGDVRSVSLISSACYEAARWCLIADGTAQIPDPTLQFSPGDNKVIGTSFAAPQISGALALLAEAFPTLTPHELRVRLLASADDGFFVPDATVTLATGFTKGYSVIYGQGFLDIEAALRPIGPTAMAMADGGQLSVSAPVLVTGSAMGDAVERALAGTDVAVQDALATPFAMPASALVTATAPTPQSTVLLAEARRTSHSLTTPAPLSAPFAGYRGETLAMTAPDTGMQAAILLPQTGETTTGLNLSHNLTDGPTRFGLGVTIARDEAGTLALGGAGGQAALAASVSLGVVQDIGRAGFFALSGEMGMADLGHNGTVAQGGVAQFNRVGFEAGQSGIFAEGDRISLGMGMPLAITSGNAVVRVPVARASGVQAEALAVDLAPTDRQVDLTLRYLAPISDQIDMTFLLAHSENFGNRAGVRDTGAALLFAMRF